MAARRRSSGRSLWVRWMLLGSVALLLAIPTASALPVAVTPEPPPPRTFSAAATWAGTDLGQASAQKDAFSISTNQQVYVNFTFFVPTGGPNVTTARVQAYYFGSVISTDQVGTSMSLTTGGANGTAVMNWSLGTFTYLLAGVYRLSASLVASNGSTVWSENFYIDAKPVDHVVSGLIIFLIVLGIVELWSIVTVGRMPRKGRSKKPAPPPPKQWDPTTAPPTGSESAATTDAPPAEPVTEETP